MGIEEERLVNYVDSSIGAMLGVTLVSVDWLEKGSEEVKSAWINFLEKRKCVRQHCDDILLPTMYFCRRRDKHISWEDP